MIIFINRLPIPSLKQYCVASFALIGIVVIYANKLLHDMKNNEYTNEKFENHVEYLEEHGYFLTACRTISREPWCIWVLINFCYCGLILFSKVIQGIIFGKLRALENQHIKDQFWNFIFLKFIFIFGVLNLENLSDVVLWCTWFSIIGFLSIHCQICKDRFEYLSFSASTPFRNHIKVLALLVFIKLACIGLIIASFTTQRSIGFSMSLFMIAESFGLTLRTLYVMTRYAVHICDIYNLAQWNNKGTMVYYIDFIFEISVVTIDFLHYLHMLVYGNFYLSMASLVICMELKRLFFDLKRRMKRHSNYLRVIEKMERKFPWANDEELLNSDKCAVCWETLDKARRLPCSHVFHHNCLRSWLEQDTSCPTCRKSLQDEKENQAQNRTTNNMTETTNANNTNNNATNQNNNNAPRQQRNTNNVFQFNGSRYFRWLPSFSLQITNGTGTLMPNLLANRASLSPEQLAEQTQQISQLFPHVPLDLIQQDLRRSNSLEITVENILEDRLNANNGSNNANDAHNNANRLLVDDFSDDDDEANLEDTSSDETDEDSANTTSTTTNNNNVNNAPSNESGETNNNNNNPAGATSTFSSLLNQTGTSLRHRNTLFSSFLDTLNYGTNTINSRQVNTTNANQVDQQLEPLLPRQSGEETGLLRKYATSPLLSENTNSLIMRKRELILSSKKRYLEKANALNDDSSGAQQQSSLLDNSNNLNNVNSSLK